MTNIPYKPIVIIVAAIIIFMAGKQYGYRDAMLYVMKTVATENKKAEEKRGKINEKTDDLSASDLCVALGGVSTKTGCKQLLRRLATDT